PGAPIAWAAAGLLSRMLYGISATDPLTSSAWRQYQSKNVALACEYGNKLFRIRKRQRPELDCVRQTERGGGRRDPQREDAGSVRARSLGSWREPGRRSANPAQDFSS